MFSGCPSVYACVRKTFYFAANRGADYCDERVCLSVCLSVHDHIFGTRRPIFTNFCACYPVV